MLITLKEILKIAEENKTAIGAFNAPNLESLEAILGAAEELNLPVILQAAQAHEELIPLEIIGPIMIKKAKEANVPICVHLDHGETLEYLEIALKMGFTSIMFDGSLLSFEENVKNTLKAVNMAREFGASVEAELGSMGKRESGIGDGGGLKIYTDPIKAKEFVLQTGIDALACSFGTTHGIYLTEPKLDFRVVEKVRRETGGIPVVMHGGSGVSDEDFRSAIKAGVRKINYFTYMDKAGGAAAREYIAKIEEGRPIFYTEIIKASTKEMKENVKNAMSIFAMH